MQRWSLESVGHRPLVIPVVLFGAGVVFGPSWGVPAWFLGCVTLGLSAASWWRAPRPGSLWLLLGSALSLGAVLAVLHAHVTFTEGDGGRVRLEGEIESVREVAEGSAWVVEVSRCNEQPARFRVKLFVTHAPELFAGQRIIAKAKLKPLVERANPGEWSDTVKRLRHGLTASGSVDGAEVLVLSKASALRQWLGHTQQALVTTVRSLDDDVDATSLLLTLAAGQRAALDDEIEEEFAKSGLAHILSVSGLHVAVLAMAVLGLLRWLLIRLPLRALRRIDARQLAAPLAIPWVWAYVVFTGVQPPAVRSAVMCSLVLLGLCWQRSPDALNALALAAGAMAALDPSSVFDLSVQLSFLAVAALIVLTPVLRAWVPLAMPTQGAGWRWWLMRLRETVVQTFTASLAVTLASVPLVLMTFHRLGWAGLLSNVVALPISFVLTLLSAGGAAVFVAAPSWSTPVLWLGLVFSKALLWCAHVFSALPFAAVQLPGPSWAVASLWWLGLLAVAFCPGRWRMMGLSTVVAAMVHLAGPAVAPHHDRLEVSFLSVGHGDSMVVSSAGHHLLIDGGGVPQGADTGRRFVLPFLRQKRIAKLDLAVLSHPHPDHALGLTSALSELPTDRLWLPAGVSEGPLVTDLLEAADVAEVEEVEVGQAPFQLGAAQVEIWGPPNDRVLLEGENDRSVVLLVRHGQVTFLLTGDIEEAAEENLNPGEVTVMKAPHHGSRTSSSAQFVERTHPQFVVFCVGAHNRFGFPHSEIVERYERSGARCYRTDLDGAITFISDGTQVSVETFLGRAR